MNHSLSRYVEQEYIFVFRKFETCCFFYGTPPPFFYAILSLAMTFNSRLKRSWEQQNAAQSLELNTKTVNYRRQKSLFSLVLSVTLSLRYRCVTRISSDRPGSGDKPHNTSPRLDCLQSASRLFIYRTKTRKEHGGHEIERSLFV